MFMPSFTKSNPCLYCWFLCESSKWIDEQTHALISNVPQKGRKFLFGTLKWNGNVGSTALRIINLCTRWRLLVGFKSLPVYLRGKDTRYTLDSGIDGPQSWSGCGGEEKKSHHCTPRQVNLDRPARNLITVLTELSQSRGQETELVWSLDGEIRVCFDFCVRISNMSQ
jgi:hypothetical protein